MRPVARNCRPSPGWRALILLVAGCVSAPLLAAGTSAGTVVQSTAVANYEILGNPSTTASNPSQFLVAERIEVDVSAQTPQVAVSSGDSDRSLLFTLTNTGNGEEAFALAVDSGVGGDDFDPQPTVPAIWFDTDGSGDLTAGDTAYAPGANEPLLAADASVDVLLVNDIPPTAADGETGRSELTATSLTGSGAPGDVFPGAGSGGSDAMLGISGGAATDSGEYLVSNLAVSVVKSQQVIDPGGGDTPVPGAVIRYTIVAEVTGPGTAVAGAISDPIPAFASYVSESIRLNGVAISDAFDADAGEFDATGTPTVVVRLGDLSQADGSQILEFDVTIN